MDKYVRFSIENVKNKEKIGKNGLWEQAEERNMSWYKQALSYCVTY